MSASLPRQAANVSATTTALSLTRSIQLNTTLEAAFAALHGAGVVSGGKVTHTSGFGVEIANGSVFFSEGKLHTLTAAQAYASIANPSTTVYLFGRVTRTDAVGALHTNEDTYALTVTHNTTGTTPSSSTSPYFPLAIILTGAAAVASINNAPPNKFIKHTSPLWQGKTTIAAADGAVIAADEEIVRSKLTVSGIIGIYGRKVLV